MKPHLAQVVARGAASAFLLLALALAANANPIVNNTPLDSTQAGSQESNLGDLVADSVRTTSHGSAQVAIVPASELRSMVIPAGHIDTQQLVEVLRAPSDDANTIVWLNLTGAQLKKALTHGLSREPVPYAGFLQISGARVTYESGPQGPVVSALILTDTDSPVMDSHTYTVATTRLLADGALGYFEIWGKGDAQDTKIPLSKALADFAQTHTPLNYHVEGRITAR